MANKVHNHAPWRGPLENGACTESTVNGKLIGWCLGSEKKTMQHDIRKDVQVSLVLDKEDLYQFKSVLYRARSWFEIHEKHGAEPLEMVALLEAIANEALK